MRSINRRAFCVWSRFSAWSKTTEADDSSTSAVTSSPRWAGRQCMKSAPGAAIAIRRAVHLVGAKDPSPLGGFDFLAHRRPDIGVDGVDACHGLVRIDEGAHVRAVA